MYILGITSQLTTVGCRKGKAKLGRLRDQFQRCLGQKSRVGLETTHDRDTQNTQDHSQSLNLTRVVLHPPVYTTGDPSDLEQ